jgi:hypothetical protein
VRVGKNFKCSLLSLLVWGSQVHAEVLLVKETSQIPQPAPDLLPSPEASLCSWLQKKTGKSFA